MTTAHKRPRAAADQARSTVASHVADVCRASADRGQHPAQTGAASHGARPPPFSPTGRWTTIPRPRRPGRLTPAARDAWPPSS